ncbi:unnamed protein product [Vitrella brassicaformis CCMP3155]|uniref:Uncharacterized protein n=3 Tax=Vitrella brassicaformis TaxID=1169539 RepID=A0A0G4FRH7_VITBC|nr:unnamed protein product [Vitrella brassicaformis CCMP3155]|eukprot:CEM16870.1 unnamed protein product [Vitrella brassicaformis CCMP3155]
MQSSASIQVHPPQDEAQQRSVCSDAPVVPIGMDGEEEIPSSPPRSPGRHAEMVRNLVETGDRVFTGGEFERALDRYSRALGVYSREKHALLQRAKCLMYLERADEAKADIELLLDLEPQNSEAIRLLQQFQTSPSRPVTSPPKSPPRARPPPPPLQLNEETTSAYFRALLLQGDVLIESPRAARRISADMSPKSRGTSPRGRPSTASTSHRVSFTRPASSRRGTMSPRERAAMAKAAIAKSALAARILAETPRNKGMRKRVVNVDIVTDPLFMVSPYVMWKEEQREKQDKKKGNVEENKGTEIETKAAAPPSPKSSKPPKAAKETEKRAPSRKEPSRPRPPATRPSAPTAAPFPPPPPSRRARLKKSPYRETMAKKPLAEPVPPRPRTKRLRSSEYQRKYSSVLGESRGRSHIFDDEDTVIRFQGVPTVDVDVDVDLTPDTTRRSPPPPPPSGLPSRIESPEPPASRHGTRRGQDDDRKSYDGTVHRQWSDQTPSRPMTADPSRPRRDEWAASAGEDLPEGLGRPTAVDVSPRATLALSSGPGRRAPASVVATELLRPIRQTRVAALRHHCYGLWRGREEGSEASATMTQSAERPSVDSRKRRAIATYLNWTARIAQIQEALGVQDIIAPRQPGHPRANNAPALIAAKLDHLRAFQKHPLLTSGPAIDRYGLTINLHARLGELYLCAQQRGRALDEFRTAMRMAVARNAHGIECRILPKLGHLCELQGDLAAAQRHWKRMAVLLSSGIIFEGGLAVRLASLPLSSPNSVILAAVCLRLGWCALKRADTTHAKEVFEDSLAHLTVIDKGDTPLDEEDQEEQGKEDVAEVNDPIASAVLMEAHLAVALASVVEVHLMVGKENTSGEERDDAARERMQECLQKACDAFTTAETLAADLADSGAKMEIARQLQQLRTTRDSLKLTSPHIPEKEAKDAADDESGEEGEGGVGQLAGLDVCAKSPLSLRCV